MNNSNLKINKISFNKETQQKKAISPADKTKKSNEIKKKFNENKKLQDNYKIQKINEYNKQNNLRWTAGETSISNLSYAEFKRLFLGSNSPSPFAYEAFHYYVGGIVDFRWDTNEISKTIGFPKSFDWRNRHGENWITPIKNQGTNCGSCWDFSSVAAVEAVTNLYYNQRLNLDLSEQQILCGTYTSPYTAMGCGGGLPKDALDYLTKNSIVPENVFGYTGGLNPRSPYLDSRILDSNYYENCGKLSSINSQSLIKISGYGTFDGTEEWLKTNLILNGPIVFGLNSLWHAMTIVGWETDFDGNPIWIIKNSYGNNWGESGYIRMKLSLADMIGMTDSVSTPIVNNIPNLNVACVDKDSDGYCNWGIFTPACVKSPAWVGDACEGNVVGYRLMKSSDDFSSPCYTLTQCQQQLSLVSGPSTCPTTCKKDTAGKLIEDCDDSNSTLSGYDNNYNCILAPIAPDTTPPVTTATAKTSDGNTYDFGSSTALSPVTVTLSCSDADSGCKEIKYCTDKTNTCAPSTTYTQPISISTTGTSYIRYFSTDNAGNSELIQSKTIIITPLPAKPTVPSPATNAINVAPTTSLSWATKTDATSYDLYLGKTNPPTLIASNIPKPTTARTTYTPTAPLSSNTQYYWRVDAKNSGGTTTGDIWQFKTALSLPGQATTPSPAINAINILTTQQLSWATRTDASSYDIYFGTTNPPVYRTNIPNPGTARTIYNPGTILANKKYYWRIDSRNSAGATTGILWSFTTKAT